MMTVVKRSRLVIVLKRCKECDISYTDPLADVRLGRDEESGLVLLTYDGCGHSYFSIESDIYCLIADAAKEFGLDVEKAMSQPTTRDRFDAMLKNVGYYAEDCNNWSMVFVYEGGEKVGHDMPDERVEEA